MRFADCRVHHVQWWDHHGPTDLANLLPLCEAHHHLVHEGHWTLTLTPDRTITLYRPDGSLHFEGNEPRPGESEIPLHLRRAAEANRAAARSKAQPAANTDPPAQPPSPDVAATQQALDRLFQSDNSVATPYGTDTAPAPATTTIPVPAEQRRGPPPRAPAA